MSSNRKTSRNKWDDPWFNKLSAGGKLLFLYFIDICDEAGFANVNLNVITVHLNMTLDNVKRSYIELSGKICISIDFSTIWLINFMKHNDKLPLSVTYHKDIIVNFISKAENPSLFLNHLDHDFISKSADRGFFHFSEFSKIYHECKGEVNRFKEIATIGTPQEKRTQTVFINEESSNHLKTMGRNSIESSEDAIAFKTRQVELKNIPTIQEVNDYVFMHYLELPYINIGKFAEEFFLHYDGQGWVTGNGIAIVNWKSKLDQWVNKKNDKYVEEENKKILITETSSRLDILKGASNSFLENN